MNRPKVKEYLKSGLIVSGDSDDIVFVAGELNDRFYAGKLILEDSECECLYMAFSDGTLLKFCYDEDGIWRFRTVFQGTLFAEKFEGSIETSSNDIVAFYKGIKWSVLSPMVSQMTTSKE